jgi:fructose-1,6-bisphosphatase II
VNISGLVTIGEGIKDEAPGIFKGEKLGGWGEGSLRMAIALDPIDGTTIVSKGLPGAISVIAAATCENESDDPNQLLADIPSFYMNKISYGPVVKQGPGRVRLDNPVQDNLEIIALKLGKRVQDLTVVILDRPRHERLIHDIRRSGAAIRMISDGDIAAAIAPSLPQSGVDVYMGTGGSPEAVLAARGSSASGARFWRRCGRATRPSARRSRIPASRMRSSPSSTPATTWRRATASSSRRRGSAIRRCSRASATRAPTRSPPAS